MTNTESAEKMEKKTIRVEHGLTSRLDTFLAEKLCISRSQIQQWIMAEMVKIGDKPVKKNTRLFGGEEIRYLPLAPKDNYNIEPEIIKLDILYEDDDLLLINKPPGLVVHPAPGNLTGTLVHGVLG